VRWLLDLQNADGGIPTFCRGWGHLPFDRSGADLTAHALRAWGAWLESVVPSVRARMRAGMERALGYLSATQRADGSWVPLWFGNEHAPEEENPTYGTARVVSALAAMEPIGAVAEVCARGVRWLCAAQHEDGGFGGAVGVPPTIEETALAVSALADAARRAPELRTAVARGAAWLVARTEGGAQTPPSPIGFYFAKLWYHEDAYPLVFTVEALGKAARVLGDGVSP
jgi:squalene-hopene/tetraprenyl-beta-curcumene cyclase